MTMKSDDIDEAGAGQAPGLDPSGVEALAVAFRGWYEAATRPAARLARARGLALFLLLRHSGAKLSEALDCDLARDLDLEAGTARLGGRENGLSEQARRELGGVVPLILESGTAGGAGQAARLGLDPGYSRRIFARLGEQAGLARELSNPSALRRYRARELAMLGAPEAVVRRILGLRPLPGPATISERDAQAATAHYARREVGDITSARNSFFGRVERIDTGDIQSLVTLQTVSGAAIAAMITNASVGRLRLAPGVWITALVKAPWVVVAMGEQAPPTSAENALPGRIARLDNGAMTAEITVELEDGSMLCALAGREAADALNARPGDRAWALFSAHAVILSAQ